MTFESNADTTDQRPTWDEYFLEMAHSVSKRATCDRGKSGCVITLDKQILVTGYVGSPAGFAHCEEAGHQMKDITHEDGSVTSHCMRTIHAEQNAIIYAINNNSSVKGATLYVTLAPCLACARIIYSCGISKVIYLNSYAEFKGLDSDEGVDFLEKFGVDVEKYNGHLENVTHLI